MIFVENILYINNGRMQIITMWKHNVPRCQGEGTLGRKSVRTHPTNCTLSLDVLHEKTQLLYSITWCPLHIGTHLPPWTLALHVLYRQRHTYSMSSSFTNAENNKRNSNTQCPIYLETPFTLHLLIQAQRPIQGPIVEKLWRHTLLTTLYHSITLSSILYINW